MCICCIALSALCAVAFATSDISKQEISADPSLFKAPNGAFTEDAYRPIVNFVIDDGESESAYITNEKNERIYPCNVIGVYKNLSDPETIYNNNYGTQSYINSSYQELDPKMAPQGNESLLIYADEKFVGSGKLVIYTDEEETTFGVYLDDQTLQLGSGCYVGINGSWNAVPRPVYQLDELGSLLADLDGSGTMVQLNLTVTKFAAYENYPVLYLDIYYNRNKTSYEMGDGDEQSLSKPDYHSRIYVYDFDGDGAMEIVTFEQHPNGIGTALIKFFDGKPKTIFGWYSE